MADEMRDRMMRALAEFLDIDVGRASEAMEYVFQATKDIRTGAPPSWQPNMDDPAEQLARRVEAAMEREFEGEPFFPHVVVVQSREGGRVGIAAGTQDFAEAEVLLRLGIGAVKRTLRQYDEPI